MYGVMDFRYSSTPIVNKANNFFMVVSAWFNGVQRRVTSKDAVLIMINNEFCNAEQVLKENDQICFMPHLDGG